MSRGFHFGLLRVTLSQLLKSIGFEKCSSSTLDIITDLYIRYLLLLLKQSMRLSQHDNRDNNIEVQDICQAMIDIGFIKPVNVLDPFDLMDVNHTSLNHFQNWLHGPTFKNAHKTNQIDTNLINKQNKSVGAFKAGDEEEDRKPVELKDWIDYLVIRQTKVGQESRFSHTALDKYSSKENTQGSDYLILGPEVPQALIDSLPYSRPDEEIGDGEDESEEKRQADHTYDYTQYQQNYDFDTSSKDSNLMLTL